MQAVEVLKEQGNNAFKAQQYPQALELYSQALHLDPQNYLLYSNRSAVYIQLKNYELALSDADMVSQIRQLQIPSGR
jgi:stress-induced-phosphoprotein 1